MTYDQILHAFEGHHRFWTGEVYLYEDGTMARPGIDSGRYEFELHERVVLKWDDWAPEELFWDGGRGLYRDREGDFTLSPISPPTPDAAVGGTPIDPRKLIIGALSCADSKYADRRERCAATWLPKFERAGAEVLFLVGAGNHPDAPKVVSPDEHGRVGSELWLPCPDDYGSLPQKTAGFARWALENRQFDFLFKCDDDTYIVPSRLVASGAAGADYLGARLTLDRIDYASGGAGYFLSPRAARELATRMAELDGLEDFLVGKHLAAAGIELRANQNFVPFGNATRRPTPGNPLVTSHGHTEMFDAHRETWAGRWGEFDLAPMEEGPDGGGADS